MGVKKVRKNPTQRSIAVLEEDYRKMMQIMIWRENTNKSAIIKEAASIGYQFFKDRYDKGLPMRANWYRITYRTDKEYDEQMDFLLNYFKTEQTALRTCLRVTFEILEKVYGKIDKLPPMDPSVKVK
jgi:hypothetical protein